MDSPLLRRAYGRHVARYSYSHRDDKYWWSKEAPYYLLANQNRIVWEAIERFMQIPEIREFLSRGDLTFVEPGFGLGPTTREIASRGLLKWAHYYAFDPNKWVCDFVRRRYGNQLGPTWQIGQARIEELIETAPPCDAIVAHWGVFMFCSEETIREFFRRTRSQGCRYILITREGSPGGKASRPESFDEVPTARRAIHHDFPAIFREIYPQGAHIYSTLGAGGLYDFVAVVTN
jgi:hypothetical protein